MALFKLTILFLVLTLSVNLLIAETKINRLNDFIRKHSEHIRTFKKIKNSSEAEKFIEDILNDKSKQVPDELDWRKENRVTEVNGYWNNLFSLTGLLEGQLMRFNRTTEKLSAQQILDCLGRNRFFVDTLNELGNFGGIETEKWYPYIDDYNYRCFYDKTKSVMSIKGGAILPNDEEKLKQFVAKYGPVAAGFDSSDGNFYYYHKGIFDEPKCKTNNPITYLLIVGYGTDKKDGDYWIARNNYGVTWGENGYIRIARGKNRCGIASYATIAYF